LLIPGLHPGYETDPILLIELWKCVRFEEVMAFEYREHVNSPFPDAIDDTMGAEKDLSNVIPLQFWHHAAS
jgi:hypothetical protein